MKKEIQTLSFPGIRYLFASECQYLGIVDMPLGEVDLNEYILPK